LKKNIIIVAVIVTIILLFDQILKIYIKSTFDYGETHALLGDWFVLEYIENQGMAFGTKFGSSIWAKLALSVFRIIAISGIIYYLILQLKKGVRREFLIAISLILAGATGNLIDSMFYDFIFPVDEYLNCGLEYNRLDGSGNWADCGYEGQVEIRHTGFLFGNVVDMFQFQATWPSWVPWLGGGQVFPAIWNVADASISLGVLMVFFRQRKYFPKEEAQQKKKLAFSMPWSKKSEVPVTEPEPEVESKPEEGDDSVEGEEPKIDDSAV
jgi:signal peptidase II